MAYSTETEPTRYADDGDWFASNAPGGSAGSSAGSGPGGRATAADLQRWNQELFGGALTDLSPWLGQTDAYQNLAASPQAQAYAKQQQATPQASPDGGSGWSEGGLTLSAGDKSRIDAMLSRYQSTDDPTYWYRLAAQHGGVDSTGEGWLDDRIMRGDGSALVKSGQVQKFQDASQSFDYPSWNDTFSYADFQAPTDVTEQNDPGFQEAMQGGIDALQRSAAARGTALDTGTLRDLQAFGQQFKANEFEKVYNRAANTYLMKRNNAADLYNQRYQQYLQGFNNALTKFGTNFGVDQSLWNRALTEGNTGFARQMSLADLGLAAIGNTANAGAGYTNNAGNLVTGIGNAQAAGSIANGNLWGNAAGRLSDIGSSFLWNRRSQDPTQDPTQSVNSGFFFGY